MSFDPKGDESRLALILAGIATMPPLEPNTLISYESISEWIGEPFPILSERSDGRGLQVSHSAMRPVINALAQRGILLLAVANEGYRVAAETEKVVWLEDQVSASIRRACRIITIARSVKPSQVPIADAERARAIEADARDEARVLRANQRERQRRARLLLS